MIIRIDDVLSATRKNKDPSVQMAGDNEGHADRETFGDSRDG
jgi:hypothetical protein